LWKAFRRACHKMELPLSNRLFGSNYMVDTYLEQVGVPYACTDQLWKAMATFANKNGLPDEYDIGQQNIWYTKFCDELPSSFPVRIKRALVNDASGFYLSFFLDKIAKSSDSNKFKEKLSAQNSPVPDYDVGLDKEQLSTITFPILSYDGDILNLNLFPGASYNEWIISIDHKQQCIEVDEQQRDIFIDSLNIQRITAQVEGGSEIEYSLWNGEKDNQFAIFDASSNQFISTHLLTDEGVVLPPGLYRILSRFDIDESWLQTDEAIEDGFFTGELEIKSGAKQTISRGPISFIIRGHSQALLTLKGKSYTPYSGSEFYVTDNLAINIQLPKEWINNGEYELKLSSPFLEQKVILPVKLIDDNEILISLSSVVGNWTAGVDRMTIILRHSGQKRVLARSSALVWFGLGSVMQGYKLLGHTLATNIIKDSCENIRIDSNDIVIKDHYVPFYTLAFSLTINRKILFKFALPGTYVYLDDPNAEMGREELILPGTTLSASFEDQRMIKIYSTEMGEIHIGKRVLHNDFEKTPWIRYSVAALVDHIDSESSQLLFVRPNYEQVLLNLVSPHIIENWSIVYKSKSLKVKFNTFSPLNTLVVTANEIINNQTISQTYQSNQGLCQNAVGQLGGMLISHENSAFKQQELDIHIDNLYEGIWILEIKALILGRWGSVSNNRKDQYAIGVIVEKGIISSFSKYNYHQIDKLNLQRKTSLLTHLNSLLSLCYEQSSWDSIVWLKNIWGYLVKDNEVVSGDNIKYILPITEQLPDENVSESWVPMLHIGGYNPSIYARNAKAYERIDIGISINLRCFKAIYESSNDLAEAIRCELVTNTLVVGFMNKLQIESEGIQPANLDLKKVDDMLPFIFFGNHWNKLLRVGKEPAMGDLLGGYHLAFAQNECLINCRRIQVGNDFLRPAMNSLAFRYKGVNVSTMRILIPDDYFENNDEKSLLESLSTMTSGLAKACREEARGINSLQPLLEQFEQGLIGNSTDLSQVLSFFLSVTGDLFHYYLLLWEIYYASRET